MELQFRHTDQAVINASKTRWPEEFALIRQAEPRKRRPVLRGATAR
ncbi:hypothetical protein WN990_15935 [Kitasatospora purpeofusca]